MYGLTKHVRVLVSGHYNGRGHQRLPRAERGDVIEVAAGGYAESLIADGYVTDNLEPLPEENEEMDTNGGEENAGVTDETVTVVEDVLAEVKGIGEATAKQLAEAGVTSWQGLVEADTAVLAETLNTTEKRVQGWQSAAQDLLSEQTEEGA